MGVDGSGRLHVGGSLPVPNVQSLAAVASSSVPHRYIRPEIAADPDVDDGGADQLPVVDLSRLLGGHGPSSRDDEAAKLRFACEEWGFFQLVNHGVAEEAVESMKAAMEGFFSLPLEGKLASSKQPPGGIEGYGQSFVVSEEQKLDWGDMLVLYAQPPHLRNTQLWPNHPPTFREALERYSSEVKKVALALLGQMGRDLGVAGEGLVGLFQEGVQGVKMNYYPPCQHHADKLLGISPHSDATGLTLLLQVNPVQGLQIRREGRWIPVSPPPGTFVVNVGDVMEILSNGRYKSIEHRVVINPERERLSIAAFHSTNADCLIGPLSELVKEGEQQQYKTLTAGDYRRLLVSTKLDGKSLLNSMKL